MQADKAYTKDAAGRYDVKGWYSKFSEVLLNLGWVSQNTAFWQYKIHGESFTADKAILEIINGLLQNNALLLAQATINALKNLPENDSKLTLFKVLFCFQVKCSKIIFNQAVFLSTDSKADITHLIRTGIEFKQSKFRIIFRQIF